jgi:hypothetical protein
MQRPMMGAKESSRCGSYSAIEYEYQISWILTKRRNTKMLNQKNGIGKHTVMVLSLLTVLFWAGSSWAGQAGKTTQLTNTEVKNLITNAKTPEEHDRLAQYFNQKAAKLEAEAKEHIDLANAYHKGKTPNMQNASLCEEAASDERKAAQENRAIADSHHKAAEELHTSAPH